MFHKDFRYTQDNVFVGEEQPLHPYGFDFYDLIVHKHPRSLTANDDDGMYFLKEIPDGTRSFIPQPFTLGSRAEVR